MAKEDEEQRKSDDCGKLEDADARELCEHLSRDLEIAINTEHTPNSSPAADESDGTATTDSTGPKDEA
jgi:hypothetical protein